MMPSMLPLILRHNLWLRNTGSGGKTAAIILTDEELTELRKHCNRVYVDNTIKEPDDEDLQLEPTNLNVLSGLIHQTYPSLPPSSPSQTIVSPFGVLLATSISRPRISAG
jgi:hypothetical protein